MKLNREARALLLEILQRLYAMLYPDENVTDGGPGSGNFGHRGRPGQRGGSGKGTGTGIVTGSPGKTKSGQKMNGADYSLKTRGLNSGSTKKSKKQWSSGGEKTKAMPKGNGYTRIAEADVRTGLHSVNKYLQKDGTLTAEREAIHQAAIDKLFAGKKPVPAGEQKVFTFLGGGSASGKGNFTREGQSDFYGIPNNKQQATIDADEMKKEIPEYNDMADREKAASFAHEESSALAKRAMEAAFANGYNCTLDGTGDGSVKGVLKKIQQARNAGYKVEGCYCTRDIEAALQSNLERAQKTGRKVQTDSVINIHKKVSEIFPQVASEFDHVRLYDHNGSEPVLIAECYRGQEIKVLDKKAYQKFLDKANYKGS